MRYRFRALLTGAGTLLDVWPDPRYGHLVPQGTDEDRQREIWQTVGADIYGAFTRHQEEHEQSNGEAEAGQATS